MIFRVPNAPKWSILGCQKALKNTSKNHQKICIEKTSFPRPKVPQNDVKIDAKYGLKSTQKTAAKHVPKIMKIHVFSKG